MKCKVMAAFTTWRSFTKWLMVCHTDVWLDGCLCFPWHMIATRSWWGGMVDGQAQKWVFSLYLWEESFQKFGIVFICPRLMQVSFSSQGTVKIEMFRIKWEGGWLAWWEGDFLPWFQGRKQESLAERAGSKSSRFPSGGGFMTEQTFEDSVFYFIVYQKSHGFTLNFCNALWNPVW